MQPINMQEKNNGNKFTDKETRKAKGSREQVACSAHDKLSSALNFEANSSMDLILHSKWAQQGKLKNLG